MNKYIKIFLNVVALTIFGFIAYVAYDFSKYVSMEDVLNLIDFIIHGK